MNIYTSIYTYVKCGFQNFFLITKRKKSAFKIIFTINEIKV